MPWSWFVATSSFSLFIMIPLAFDYFELVTAIILSLREFKLANVLCNVLDLKPWYNIYINTLHLYCFLVSSYRREHICSDANMKETRTNWERNLRSRSFAYLHIFWSDWRDSFKFWKKTFCSIRVSNFVMTWGIELWMTSQRTVEGEQRLFFQLPVLQDFWLLRNK